MSWIAAQTGDGRTYYVEINTKATSWSLPEGAQLQSTQPPSDNAASPSGDGGAPGGVTSPRREAPPASVVSPRHNQQAAALAAALMRGGGARGGPRGNNIRGAAMRGRRGRGSQRGGPPQQLARRGSFGDDVRGVGGRGSRGSPRLGRGGNAGRGRGRGSSITMSAPAPVSGAAPAPCNVESLPTKEPLMLQSMKSMELEELDETLELEELLPVAASSPTVTGRGRGGARGRGRGRGGGAIPGRGGLSASVELEELVPIGETVTTTVIGRGGRGGARGNGIRGRGRGALLQQQRPAMPANSSSPNMAPTHKVEEKTPPRTQYATVPTRPEDFRPEDFDKLAQANAPKESDGPTQYASIPSNLAQLAGAPTMGGLKEPSAASHYGQVMPHREEPPPKAETLSPNPPPNDGVAAVQVADGSGDPSQSPSLKRVVTPKPALLKRETAKRAPRERRPYPFDEEDNAETITFETEDDVVNTASSKGKKGKKNKQASKVALLSPRSNDVLKAATLEKLIGRLTSAVVVPDTQFVRDFLMTYKSFTTGSELLDLLMLRFEVPPPTSGEDLLNEEQMEAFVRGRRIPIRLRVVSVLNTWIERHWDDFAEDEELLRSLRRFVAEKITVTMPSTGKTLQEALQKKIAGADRFKPTMFVHTPPPPEAPESIADSEMATWSHVNVKPLEIARQLTLIEFDLYSQIKAGEFLNQAWTRKDKHVKAPNILRFIDRFNRVSQWVASSICSERDRTKRLALINHFVEVALHLKKLNNFNGVMELLSGMASSAVYRLRKTWDSVEDKRQQQLGILQEMCASSENYKILRAYLKALQPPSIPYLGVFLTDLMFIDTGIKDHVETPNSAKLIHFSKARKIASVINIVQRSQQTPYSLLSVSYMQRLLTELKINTEDENYKLSLEIEPRKRQNPDAKPIVEQVEEKTPREPSKSDRPRMCEDCNQHKVAAIIRMPDGKSLRYLCKGCTTRMEAEHSERSRKAREQEEAERRAQQEAEDAVARRRSLKISAPLNADGTLRREDAGPVTVAPTAWSCSTCKSTNQIIHEQCMTCGALAPITQSTKSGTSMPLSPKQQQAQAQVNQVQAKVSSQRLSKKDKKALNASAKKEVIGQPTPLRNSRGGAVVSATQRVSRGSKDMADAMLRTFDAKEVFSLPGGIFVAAKTELTLKIMHRQKKKSTSKPLTVRLRVKAEHLEDWAKAFSTAGAERHTKMDAAPSVGSASVGAAGGPGVLKHGAVERLESKRFGTGGTYNWRYAVVRADGALALGVVPDMAGTKKRNKDFGSTSRTNSTDNMQRGSDTSNEGTTKRRRQFFGLRLGGTGTVQREMKWDDKLRSTKSQYRMKVNFALPGLCEPVMLPLEPDTPASKIVEDLFQIFGEQLVRVVSKPSELVLMVAPSPGAPAPRAQDGAAKVSKFYFSEQHLLTVMPAPVGVYGAITLKSALSKPQAGAPIGVSLSPLLPLCELLRFVQGALAMSRPDFTLVWRKQDASSDQWLKLTRSLRTIGLGDEQSAKSGYLMTVTHHEIVLAAQHMEPHFSGLLVQVRRKSPSGASAPVLVPRREGDADASKRPIWCALHDCFLIFSAEQGGAPTAVLNLMLYSSRVVQFPDGGTALALERHKEIDVLPIAVVPRSFVLKVPPTSDPQMLQQWCDAIHAFTEADLLPCALPLNKIGDPAPARTQAQAQSPNAAIISPRGATAVKGVATSPRSNIHPKDSAAQQLASMAMAAAAQRRAGGSKVGGKAASPRAQQAQGVAQGPKAVSPRLQKKPAPTTQATPEAAATSSPTLPTTPPQDKQVTTPPKAQTTPPPTSETKKTSPPNVYQNVQLVATPTDDNAGYQDLPDQPPSLAADAFESVRQMWYYRAYTREEAIEKIGRSEVRAGDFVVRPSSKPDSFALTFRKKTAVAHSLLRYRTSPTVGWSIEKEERMFATVDELLQSYPGIVYKESRAPIVFGEVPADAPGASQYTQVPVIKSLSNQPLLPISALPEMETAETDSQAGSEAPPPPEAEEEVEEEHTATASPTTLAAPPPPLSAADVEPMIGEVVAAPAVLPPSLELAAPVLPKSSYHLDVSHDDAGASSYAGTETGLLIEDDVDSDDDDDDEDEDAKVRARFESDMERLLQPEEEGTTNANADTMSAMVSSGEFAANTLLDERESFIPPPPSEDADSNTNTTEADASNAPQPLIPRSALMGLGNNTVSSDRSSQYAYLPVQVAAASAGSLLTVSQSGIYVSMGEQSLSTMVGEALALGDNENTTREEADEDADNVDRIAAALEDDMFVSRTCAQMRRDVLIRAMRSCNQDAMVHVGSNELTLHGEALVRWAQNQVDAVAGRREAAIQLLQKLVERGVLLPSGAEFDASSHYDVALAENGGGAQGSAALQIEMRLFSLADTTPADDAMVPMLDACEAFVSLHESDDVWLSCGAPLLSDSDGDTPTTRLSHLLECVCALRRAEQAQEDATMLLTQWLESINM